MARPASRIWMGEERCMASPSHDAVMVSPSYTAPRDAWRPLLKVRQLGESGVVLDVVPRTLVPRLFEQRAGVVLPANGDEMLRQVEAGFAFLARSLLLVRAYRGKE